MSEAWINYSDTPPPGAGVYEWRVPSKAVHGTVVIFAAHMRERGAGYVDVISPSFDYWDGYRLHLPVGLQWRPADAKYATTKWHETVLIGIEGLEHCACIYCGKIPTLHGVERARDGGVFVSGKPHELNSWWLSCCSWGKTPSMSDPREIERIRREAFAKATGGAQ